MPGSGASMATIWAHWGWLFLLMVSFEEQKYLTLRMTLCQFLFHEECLRGHKGIPQPPFVV